MRTIDETLAALKGLGIDSQARRKPGPAPIDRATDGPDAWADRAGELELRKAARKERAKLETLRKRRKLKGRKQKAPPRPNKGGRAGNVADMVPGVLERVGASHGASKRLFVDWLRAHPWSTQAEIKAGLDGSVPRGSVRAYCSNGQKQGYVESRTREMGRLYPGGPPRPIAEYRLVEGPAAGVKPPAVRWSFLG